MCRAASSISQLHFINLATAASNPNASLIAIRMHILRSINWFDECLQVEVVPAVGPFPRSSNVAQEACHASHNQSSSWPGFASQAGCAPGASQQARSHRHTAGLPSAGCPQSIGSVSPEAKDRQGCSTLSWTAYPDSPTSPAAQTAPG